MSQHWVLRQVVMGWKRVARKVVPIAALQGLLACGGMEGNPDDLSADVGKVSLKVQAAEQEGLGGVFYEVLDADGALLKSAYAALEEEPFPEHLSPEGQTYAHFADTFFVLEPGAYRVRATPMDDAEPPPGKDAPRRSKKWKWFPLKPPKSPSSPPVRPLRMARSTPSPSSMAGPPSTI